MDGTSMAARIQFEKVATDVGTFWRANQSAAVLREHLRSFSRAGTKTAEAAGSSEAGFEQAFSSLAYAYLKDRAPRLLDYMVGFQLVERNEDNTKAVGVFGFHVGDQWLYAPVFFLNGELKGHELLYIKNQDSFAPLKENWVNYLMSRKPHVLGEATEKDTFRLGGLMPDLMRLNITPLMNKRSIDEWALPAMPLMAALMTKAARGLYSEAEGQTKLAFDQVVQHPWKAALAELHDPLDLGQYLSQDFSMLKTAFDLAQSNPGIKRGFDRFYGPNCFSKWAEQLRGNIVKQQSNLIVTEKKAQAPLDMSLELVKLAPQPPHPIKTGELKAYIADDTPITQNLDELDDAEREKLLRDTVLIKDKRDPHAVSQAYNVQVESKLSNPHETGLYQVLERPGEFQRMLVISHPQSSDGQKDFCTLVRVGDGGKAWLNAHRTTLWASKIEDRKEFESWFEGLSKSDSLQKGGMYLALGENGTGTVPFTVREVYGDGTFKVDFKSSCDYSYDRPTGAPRMAESAVPEDYVSSYDVVLAVDVEGRRGTKLRVLRGEMRIPGNFKFLKLKDPPKPKKPDSGLLMPEPMVYEGNGSEDKPIQPGKLEDVQALFLEKTARIKLYDDHHEVSIGTDWHPRKRMTKKAALLTLVLTHGLNEETARQMLKQAAIKGSQTFRIAYAPGFGPDQEKQASPTRSMLEGGPTSPAPWPTPIGMESFGNRNAVRSQYPDEQQQLVPALDSSRQDPSVHDIWRNYTFEDIQKTQGQAQQAAEGGQKEVFDTAMLRGLLKSVRQDSIVDRYLGALMKAVDRLGRILFLFYYHQEEFEDRYSKSDLPELEDSLRNSFESLGDLVLFLKERSVEPVWEGAQTGPNIEDVAQSS